MQQTRSRHTAQDDNINRQLCIKREKLLHKFESACNVNSDIVANDIWICNVSVHCKMEPNVTLAMTFFIA